MNPLLLQPEVQQYLLNHSHRDPGEIALERSPFDGISSGELAAQADARRRSRYKLPEWYQTPGIYYPRRLSVEQSSSAITAWYKASLLPPDSRVLDMTGGFGVDSFAFAKVARQVTYCERDAELAAIVQHNAAVLMVQGIDFHAGDGLECLAAAAPGQYDLIFLDPARRMGSRKTFRLEDCEPNVPELLPALFEKSDLVLLKLAPMLDIQEAVRQLDHLQEIHILSVDGECRELLCLLAKAATDPVEAVQPGSPSAEIVVTAFSTSGTASGEMAGHSDRAGVKTCRFRLSDEQESIALTGSPRRYLYEPDAALLKSGAFKWIGRHYGLHKLHRHTHLYTSDELVTAFIGKITLIEDVIPYSTYKKNKKPLPGNVIARNFPLKPADLRKRHGIREDKERNLYFCTGGDGRLLVIQTVPSDR